MRSDNIEMSPGYFQVFNLSPVYYINIFELNPLNLGRRTILNDIRYIRLRLCAGVLYLLKILNYHYCAEYFANT